MNDHPPERKPADSDLRKLAELHDHSHMAEVISRIPDQIDIGLAEEFPRIQKGPFRQAIIAGMGGSALPVDVVLDAFCGKIRVPVRSLRHYNLPVEVDDSTLFIASSFSGTTEETLSAIQGFPKNAGNVVVVTGGGELSAIARERGYPLVRIPKEREPEGFQPRSAVGYFVVSFARILFEAGVMDDPRPDLAALPAFLREAPIRKEAEETAAWIKNRIPIVYTDEIHLSSVARVAKIKFNENSKRPAFFNALPEANHNEMIGFSKPLADFALIYLHDPDSHPKIRRRFDVMNKVFSKRQLNHVDFRMWNMPGATRVQRIFAALVFVDWCSYALALLDGIDPTPVDLVESFKQELEKPL
ncbi:MAG: hypothetical protein HY788_12430 [Deltaproteobacteria bacterium]|nr:hypothetical protein [Deltaproteobacteria bacterium]